MKTPGPECQIIFEALALIYAYTVSDNESERKKIYEHFKKGLHKRFEKIQEESGDEPDKDKPPTKEVKELWPSVFDED